MLNYKVQQSTKPETRFMKFIGSVEVLHPPHSTLLADLDPRWAEERGQLLYDNMERQKRPPNDLKEARVKRGRTAESSCPSNDSHDLSTCALPRCWEEKVSDLHPASVYSSTRAKAMSSKRAPAIMSRLGSIMDLGSG